MSTRQLFLFFVFFTMVKSLPIFDKDDFGIYSNNIVDNNVSRISQRHCYWLAKHCGKTYVADNEQVMKIYGGHAAKLGELPWVVYLETRVTLQISGYRKKIITKCTGTLISRSHVLTAVHCFLNGRRVSNGNKSETQLNQIFKILPNHVIVDNFRYFNQSTTYKAQMITGRVNLFSKNGQLHEEKARLLSPDYASGGKFLLYDYVIIEIEPPLDEAAMENVESTVRPACLPQYGQRWNSSKGFQVAGWGKAETTFYSNILKTITTYEEECLERIKNETYSEPFEPLCTTYSSRKGDSGGGYIYSVNGRAIVVAITQGIAIPLKNETAQNIAVRLAQLNAPGEKHNPIKWIQDHLWPKFLNPYPH